MKNLNEKEMKLLKGAIINEIENAEENEYREYKRNNIVSAKRIENYIDKLRKLLDKLE